MPLKMKIIYYLTPAEFVNITDKLIAFFTVMESMQISHDTNCQFFDVEHHLILLNIVQHDTVP